MTDHQWTELLAVIAGEPRERPPVGFIIDCPWLPNWAGRDILDYFTSEDLWFAAHRKAIEAFPEVTFLPGFWSEFGMCTEPSAFGAKCVFHRNEFPFADKVIRDVAQIDDLAEPDPATDGLLPFMLNRLKTTQPRIEELGHKIRFSVSRGPLNIATFLMGTTEFLMALKTDPDKAHKLLRMITSFLKQWHALQRKTFPSIDGMFMLDDIVGFVGTEDFREFGLPYFKDLYAADNAVKFFHNDAKCEKSIGFYPEIGINLYNPGIFNPLEELRCDGNFTVQKTSATAWTLSGALQANATLHLDFRDADGVADAETLPIAVTPDEPPRITVTAPPEGKEVFAAPTDALAVTFTATDNFGLESVALYRP
ncbi:MAG: uroporphyrinogen decarboxylase family protein, partial [Verrucomicrobiota bacterium]